MRLHSEASISQQEGLTSEITGLYVERACLIVGNSGAEAMRHICIADVEGM